jgi:2-polyprenyl-3-methyl-5-hydroxy-6-metoxy-1,4-benzoquinol methylase
VLNNLTGTPQYLAWLARKLRPHVGDTVLEIGAGIGNITGRLMARRTLYVAAEKDALHLHALNNRFLRTPHVVVQSFDPDQPGGLTGAETGFDTVLCLNVLEYMEQPGVLLDYLRGVLKDTGTLLVLVPNGLGLFGTLDVSLGQRRRYNKAELARLLEAHGFSLNRAYQLNKAGTLPWWIYSRILRTQKIGRLVLKVFDKTVWIWSRLDPLLPWPGLSLVAVASKQRPAG